MLHARRHWVEQRLGEVRTQDAVALELNVVAEHVIADAHQLGHRHERTRRQAPILDAQIESVQQVGRCGRAVGNEFTGCVGAVHQPGRDRIDGVPPAIRSEVRSRQFEHSGRVWLTVQRSGRRVPVGRDVLTPLEVGAIKRVVPERGQVEDHEDPNDDRHHHPHRQAKSSDRANV